MGNSSTHMPPGANGKTLLQWLLFAGVFFCPLLDGGIHVGGTRIVLLHIYVVGIVTLALLDSLALLERPERRSPVSNPNYARFWLALWTVSWFLSVLVSTHWDVAVLELIRDLELLLFGVIVARSMRTAADLRFLLVAFIGAAVWVSLIGWVQAVWGNNALLIRQYLQVNSRATNLAGVFVGDRTVTVFGDPITSGQFLCTALAAALAWALSTHNRRARRTLIGVTAVIALPLLTSGSRGPILAGAAASFILIISRMRSGRRKIVLLTVPVMLFLGAVILIDVDPFTALAQQSVPSGGLLTVLLLRVSQTFAVGSLPPRVDYWAYVIDMAVQNPLGVGLRNFSFTASSYIPAFLLDIRYGSYSVANSHAESMYFTQLAEAGFLGLVSLLGLVISVGVQLVFGAHSKFWGIRDVDANLAFVVLGAWMALSMSSVTSYGYANNGIAVIFWLLTGLGMAVPRIVRHPGKAGGLMSVTASKAVTRIGECQDYIEPSLCSLDALKELPMSQGSPLRREQGS